MLLEAVVPSIWLIVVLLLHALVCLIVALIVAVVASIRTTIQSTFPVVDHGGPLSVDDNDDSHAVDVAVDHGASTPCCCWVDCWLLLLPLHSILCFVDCFSFQVVSCCRCIALQTMSLCEATEKAMARATTASSNGNGPLIMGCCS
jgi:hypothetical protein